MVSVVAVDKLMVGSDTDEAVEEVEFKDGGEAASSGSGVDAGDSDCFRAVVSRLRGPVLKNCVNRLFMRGKVVRFGASKSIFSFMTSGRSDEWMAVAIVDCENTSTTTWVSIVRHRDDKFPI
jgi:hypothetical protein